ncbi:MAG: AIR synthase-related protein, partial [Planctomycetota bacterium]
TSGVGLVPPGRELDDRRIEAGDAVVVTGPVGDHGATVLAARHDVEARTLASDVAPLGGLVEAAFASGAALRSLHDPTRGGLATVAHEVAVRAGLRVVLDEDAIPIRPEVAAVGDLLGVDPLYLACEGRAVLFVAAADADRLVAALRAHPLGRDAAVIGAVDPRPDGRLPLILRTRFGGERPLDLLTGMDLPRIC